MKQKSSVLNTSLGLVISVLAIASVVFFLPAFTADFINWDDYDYVVNNPYISAISWHNFFQLFSEFRSGNYHPISVLSYMLDFRLDGLNPLVFHSINIFIHLTNGTLVFLLITKLTNDKLVSFLVSILFVVNPMQVETVVWVAERKNLLYTFFFLFSMVYYIRFIEKHKTKYYVLTLLFFLLACLSKATAVSLVPILFLLDHYYGVNPFSNKNLKNKIPFFIIALIIGSIAIIAQKHSESINLETPITLFERIVIASDSFLKYIIRLLIPVKLSAMYPYPAHGKIPLSFYLFGCISITLFLLLIKNRNRIQKIYLFGFLFYFFNIVLVLQLLPVGRFTMADRYMYLPCLGIYIILILAFKKMYEQNKTTIFIILIYSTTLGVLTYKQSATWKNDIVLWTNVINTYPTVEEAYDYRADAFGKIGKYTEAISDYDKLISLIPNKEVALNNRAYYKQILKDNIGAIEDYSKALELKPDYTDAYWGRAIALREINEYADAIEDYNSVQKLMPTYKDVAYQKGYTKLLAGNFEKSISDFEDALKQGGNLALIYNNKAIAHNFLKQYDQAIVDLTAAIKIKPDYGEAYFNRALVHLRQTDSLEACNDFTHALNSGYEKSRVYIQKYCDL